MGRVFLLDTEVKLEGLDGGEGGGKGAHDDGVGSKGMLLRREGEVECRGIHESWEGEEILNMAKK